MEDGLGPGRRAGEAAQAGKDQIGQVRTLSVERLGRRLARASDEELAAVVDGLVETIG